MSSSAQDFAIFISANERIASEEDTFLLLFSKFSPTIYDTLIGSIYFLILWLCQAARRILQFLFQPMIVSYLKKILFSFFSFQSHNIRYADWFRILFNLVVMSSSAQDFSFSIVKAWSGRDYNFLGSHRIWMGGLGNDAFDVKIRALSFTRYCLFLESEYGEPNKTLIMSRF